MNGIQQISYMTNCLINCLIKWMACNQFPTWPIVSSIVSSNEWHPTNLGFLLPHDDVIQGDYLLANAGPDSESNAGELIPFLSWNYPGHWRGRFRELCILDVKKINPGVVFAALWRNDVFFVNSILKWMFLTLTLFVTGGGASKKLFNYW